MRSMETGFAAADVTRATGVDPGVLQNWLKRPVIVGGADRIEGGGSPGKHRRFTLQVVMQIALAKELIDVSSGMELKTAFGSAMQFAHFGETEVGWVYGDKDESPKRSPGLPFHYAHGDTLLLVRGQSAEVVLIRKGEDERLACLEVMGDSYVRIDAGAVFRRVCGHLGLDPFKLQDAAYPDEVARMRAEAKA